jgi:hypothetical protein
MSDTLVIPPELTGVPAVKKLMKELLKNEKSQDKRKKPQR